MSTTYENSRVPESEKVSVPKTAFDRTIRELADAAMSVCNHDCSPEYDVEWHHEVKTMEDKFRKILKRRERRA